MVKSFVLFIYLFWSSYDCSFQVVNFQYHIGGIGACPIFCQSSNNFFFLIKKRKKEKITVYSFDDLQEQRRYRFSCLLIVVENLELVFTNHPSLLSYLKFI